MPLSKEQQDHLTALAKTAAEKVVKKITGGEGELTELQKAEQRSMAWPTPPAIIVKEEGKEEFQLMRLFKALIHRDDRYAPFEVSVCKAVEETSDTAGGYFVPYEQSPEIIDILYAKAVIRQMGVGIEPMKSMILEIPKLTGGATAVYQGEGDESDEQNIEAGMVKLIARELIVLLPVSNRWLADAGPSAEKKVRESIGRSMYLKENIAMLTGAGGASPLGLINMPNANVLSSVAVGSLDHDTVIDMVTETQNAESDITGFITTPTLAGVLRKVKDPVTGLYLWRDALDAKQLDILQGRPATITTTAKNPDTTSTHYIIGCDWAGEVVIGERQGIEFAVSTDVNFKKNQTVIRALARHDIVARHEEAITIQPITGN